MATRYKLEGAWHRGTSTTGGCSGPTGVGSTARVESTAAKVGKVSRVAEAPRTAKALRISGKAVKSQRARETDGWGRSKR